jgi:hypothetical protein
MIGYSGAKMTKTDLLVVGYPRSGNTFTSRLLGDALDSPVAGYLNAHPIAEEGVDRPGEYTIRQLHLRLSHADSDRLLPDAWTFAARRWQGEKVAFLLRDPRDVAVSVMYYWRMGGIDEALEAMFRGGAPLTGVGPWARFVTPWLESNIPQCLCYEDLIEDTAGEITMLLNGLGIPLPDPAMLKAAVLRQSFEVRKAELEANGDRYMYGKEIQLHNLRKGIPGDWIYHFQRRQAQAAEIMWGDLLRRLGYETEPDWWMEISE